MLRRIWNTDIFLYCLHYAPDIQENVKRGNWLGVYLTYLRYLIRTLGALL